MFHIAGFCVALTVASVGAFATTLQDSEAAKHVGETVTLDCLVVSVHSTNSGTTFLNCGADYPNQNAQLVIFRSAAGQFADVQRYQGKHVMAHGVLKSYRGKPEIVLESVSQIEGTH